MFNASMQHRISRMSPSLSTAARMRYYHDTASAAIAQETAAAPIKSEAAVRLAMCAHVCLIGGLLKSSGPCVDAR